MLPTERNIMAKQTAPEPAPKKQPRHIAIGTRHLIIQRNKLIAIRENAIDELRGIDAALMALGWQEQLNPLP